MTKILNVGVGVLTNSNEIKIYSISKPKSLEEKVISVENSFSIEQEVEDSISNLDIDVSYYGTFNEQALINEDSFYLELKTMEENHQFFYIKQGLTKEKLVSEAEQIGLKKEDFQSLDKNQEKLKFLILEREKDFLLCGLNPYNQIIKHKSGISLGRKPTKFDIEYGIVFPEFISAILDKFTLNLSIISVIDFERMFNLKAVRLAQAKNVLEKFKSREYKLGKDKIELVFSEDIDLEKEKYGKTRQITYLSSHNPEKAQYKTSSIEEAMSHLPEEEQLEINDGEIRVTNEFQFKTFVAILHDSILHRMLSDSYESL